MSIEQEQSARRYYYGVDAIRFFAAVLVVIYHLGFSCWAAEVATGAKYQQDAFQLPALLPVSWFGWVGVQIFFVISGFVIASSAERASPWKFMQGRMVRLYPAVWICATATLSVIYLDNSASYDLLWRYIITMSLLPTGPWLDGQYWSLGVEIVFYGIVFALLLFGARRHLTRTSWIIGSVSAVYLVAAMKMPGIRFLGADFYRMFLLEYGVFFAIGMFLSECSRGRPSAISIAMQLPFVLAGILQIQRDSSFKIAAMARVSGLEPADFGKLWTVPVTIWLASVVAIVASIIWRHRLEALPKWGREIMRRLGATTYPLYLIHYAIGVIAIRRSVQAGVPAYAAFAIVVVAMIALAMLIGKYAEPAVASAFKPRLERWRNQLRPQRV